MRTPIVPVLAFLFVLAPTSLAAEKIQKDKAEVQWAKRIINDFLEACFAEEWHNAVGLLSPDLAKASSVGGGNEILIKIWQSDSAQITSQEVAPDQSEVIFSGKLAGEYQKGTFVARVAKESSRSWSIRYFRVRVTEQKPIPLPSPLVQQKTDKSRNKPKTK